MCLKASMTSFTCPLKIFLSPDSRIVTWPLIDGLDSIVHFRECTNTLLDLLRAQLDQIIALDRSTYPIKVVKCMAFAQATQTGPLGRCRVCGRLEPICRFIDRAGLTTLSRLRITAFHLAQTAGSTQASLSPDMPCSNIWKVQICEAVSQLCTLVVSRSLASTCLICNWSPQLRLN